MRLQKNNSLWIRTSRASQASNENQSFFIWHVMSKSILMCNIHFIRTEMNWVNQNNLVLQRYIYIYFSMQHLLLWCWFIDTLQWRHNEYDGISNHRRLDCLLNHLFRRRSKKTSKPCVIGLCEGNPPTTGNSPRKGPVTWKCFHLMTSS